MSQSTLIGGALIAAFLVFITLNGRLPFYLAVFGIGAGSTTTLAGNAAGSLASTLTGAASATTTQSSGNVSNAGTAAGYFSGALLGLQ